MSRIELETFVAAPPDRCFDLSLSVELHLDSTAHTRERAVAARKSGLLGLGESVTWEARHFGLVLRLATEITVYDRAPHLRRLLHKRNVFIQTVAESGDWRRYLSS